MKVYIGPYQHRLTSTIYDRYMQHKYGYINWPENQSQFEKTLEKVEDGLQWLYDMTINGILDKRSNQKVRVRIDPHDTWSMDNTLAHIILPMLKQLKNNTQGSPEVDFEDVPVYLLPPKGQENLLNTGSVDDNHHQRWMWVLNEMTWAFEQVNSDWEDQYTVGNYDFQFEKVENGYSKMVEGPNHTAKTDWDSIKEHQNRMKKGFMLFGKYYQALWT